jgi:hypothetical protein
MKFYRIVTKNSRVGLENYSKNSRNDRLSAINYIFYREDVLAFIFKHAYIREVEVPPTVIVDSGLLIGARIWFANKIRLGPKRKVTATVVKELIAEGANVHVRDDAPLCKASWMGQPSIVKVLLEAGANPNVSRGEPLRRACMCNRPRIVKLLLEAGADVGQGGAAALEWAASNGSYSITKALVNAGVIIDLENLNYLLWSINGVYPKIHRLLTKVYKR